MICTDFTQNSTTQIEIMRELVLLSHQILKHTPQCSEIEVFSQFLIAVIEMDDQAILESVTPLCIAALIDVNLDDSKVLPRLEECIRTLCTMQCFSTIQQILFIVLHAIAMNQIHDSYLRLSFITYCRAPTLREAIEVGLSSLFRNTSKGDLNDYLLDGIVDWLRCDQDEANCIEPIRFLLKTTKGIDERKVINTLIAFFVKTPSLPLLELIASYKTVWDEHAHSLLEEYSRGEQPFRERVQDELRSLKRAKRSS